MTIEGKVAKILNSREIAINKGSEDGVKTGMKFNVQRTGNHHNGPLILMPIWGS